MKYQESNEEGKLLYESKDLKGLLKIFKPIVIFISKVLAETKDDPIYLL